jgi:hypothetical protein
MDREDVDSSAIASVGFQVGFGIETGALYRFVPGILEIQFTDGSVYRYHNVPGNIVQEMMESASPGAYFNFSIRRGPYSYTRIG